MRAIESRISPREVEVFVGRPASLNSTRPFHPIPFALERYDFDQPTLDLLDLRDREKPIVYWNRSRESTRREIVGIVWIEEAKPVFFSGTWYPP